MSIIEFACAKLLPGISISDPILLSNLRTVKQVIESYNHLQTIFYSQKEDASILYVIGSWESSLQHSQGFVGSAAQKEILNLVKDQMEIKWMHYIDVPLSRIPLDAPALLISKYLLPVGTNKRTVTDALIASVASQLNNHATGHVGGWSLRRAGEEVDVWVGFTGCRVPDGQEAPAEIDDQVGYAPVAEILQHDTVHATKVDLPIGLSAW